MKTTEKVQLVVALTTLGLSTGTLLAITPTEAGQLSGTYILNNPQAFLGWAWYGGGTLYCADPQNGGDVDGVVQGTRVATHLHQDCNALYNEPDYSTCVNAGWAKVMDDWGGYPYCEAC
jgi:hypothetical protein